MSCPMQILLQKKVFSEVRHPGERVQAKGREAYGCVGYWVGLLFLFTADTCPASPPRIGVPKRGPAAEAHPLTHQWPGVACNCLSSDENKQWIFPGHLANHGMQSRQELSIIFILERFPSHFHSQLFFSFLHLASKHPAQMNSCSFHTPFFHFHNHSTQLFRFHSCLSHFPHTLPSARWPLNETQ